MVNHIFKMHLLWFPSDQQRELKTSMLDYLLMHLAKCLPQFTQHAYLENSMSNLHARSKFYRNKHLIYYACNVEYHYFALLIV